MTAYATRRDLYSYGLPRGTLGMQSREVSSALASTDTFEVDGHGFEDGDAVLVRAAEGGTLPAPLAAATTYYVLRESDATFKLSLTDGGAAIDLTTDGVDVFVASALPFDEVLEFYSRYVDDFIPAHAVPLTAPYPVVITAAVAMLAAKRLQILAGHTSESMTETEKSANEQLARWAKGIPLRDARATTATNVAVTSIVSPSSAADSRGWGSGCLP